jgi:hypothetical protein
MTRMLRSAEILDFFWIKEIRVNPRSRRDPRHPRAIL